MAAFSARPVCYQVSVLLLLVSSCMFGIGMMLPWWAQTQLDGAVTSHSGLWLGCLSEAPSPSSSSVGSSSMSSSASLETSPAESSSTSVESCSPIEAPGWFKAVQVMQCLALSGMGIACAYAIFTNCCLDQIRYSRVIEVSSGLGGAVGIISGVVYLVKTSTALRHSRHIRYSWAFGLDMAACVLVLFDAAIIGLTNSQRRDYSSRREYLRRMDNRLAVSDDETVERRSRSTSRSRSRSLPSGSEIRGLMVEMERSPARTRRLDGISRDSSSCGGVASSEALVVVQNRDGTRSATTATILQRPTSGFLDPHPQLLYPPQRPRSACDESHLYQNPLDLLSHHPSIASVCSRTAQALGTGSPCSCSHTSVSYLSEPQTVSVSRRSSCISIPKNSCASLHYHVAHQACELSTNKLVHACSWCHEHNAHEIAGLGGVCTCCTESHQVDCKAVGKKSGSCVHLESSRAPKKDCRCSDSEEVDDCQAHRLSYRNQNKGCYMAVPTEADDEHLSLKKAHNCDCSETKPVKVLSVHPCTNYQSRSPCLQHNPCRTDHKPVCAVHGHASSSCADSDKENEEASVGKMPLMANASLQIHKPRPAASAPPLEIEHEPEQIEYANTAMLPRQG